MASNITATVSVDGLTYTGTIDRSSRKVRPVSVECSDGRLFAGEWESAHSNIAVDPTSESMPDAAHDALCAALDSALMAAMRG